MQVQGPHKPHHLVTSRDLKLCGTRYRNAALFLSCFPSIVVAKEHTETEVLEGTHKPCSWCVEMGGELRQE